LRSSELVLFGFATLTRLFPWLRELVKNHLIAFQVEGALFRVLLIM
jgi:hypothetical protein